MMIQDKNRHKSNIPVSVLGDQHLSDESAQLSLSQLISLTGRG